MNKKEKTPPKIAKFLMNIFSDPDSGQPLLGDAEEEFKDNCEEKGVLHAYAVYWVQVFISIPAFLKRIISWRFVLIKNYSKITLRNCRRSKGYTFINISGFAIGLATCMMILLYIVNELSYDRYHKNTDSIYRVALERTYPDKVRYWGCTVPVIAEAFVQDFPERMDRKKYFR